MRTFEVAILFSLLSVCLSTCGQTPQAMLSKTRIIGGRVAREHSWPWIVSIHRTDTRRLLTSSDVPFCAGTLIRDKYVLTAAHCFYNFNQSLISNYFVVIGTNYLNDTDAIRFRIKSIRLHEKYDDNLYLNDIALLELSCKVDLKNSNIGLICLPQENISIYPYERMDGIVAGWGSLEENGTISNTLQEIKLPIMANKEESCVQQISENLTQFCAGLIEGGADACQGDSGGPLMISDKINRTWHIAGITSYGYGCARAENPGVYTRVSVYMDWIAKHTNSSSMKQISMTSLWLLFCIIIYFRKE